MDVVREKLCIEALSAICQENFDADEYAILGVKESAVCIELKPYGWEVYEKEKNSRNDMFLFDNVVDACLDVLKRLSSTSEYKILKESFYDKIIVKKIA